MVIQINSQMFQNRFKLQGHNKNMMIEPTMDRGISPLKILAQGPKHSQYEISLLAKDQSPILH